MERFVTRQLSKLVLGLCMLMVVNACKKNEATPTFAGRYTGKLIYSDSGIAYNHIEGLADVTFTSDNYTASNVFSSALAYSGPVASNGTYQVNADSITFTNAVIPPGTGQTSTLTLTGKYQYHFEGDSLILTRQYTLGTSGTFSQYRLKRN